MFGGTKAYSQNEWAFLFSPYDLPACSKPLDLRSLGVGGWRR